MVNAENAAAGSGLTVPLAEEIFKAGVDAISLGDHTWGQKEFPGQIGSVDRLVRPANYPLDCPGKGWTLVTLPTCQIAVVNVQGRVFMNPVDCPFKTMDRILNACTRQTLAESAVYAYNKGGNQITGPSIRLAWCSECEEQ